MNRSIKECRHKCTITIACSVFVSKHTQVTKIPETTVCRRRKWSSNCNLWLYFYVDGEKYTTL